MSDMAVSGRPSKAFFLDMITKDLTVEDALLDLIDNAIDEAVERQRVNVMTVLTAGGDRPRRFSDARVDVRISADRIEVVDNCGGIPVDEARTSVFRFGNPGKRAARGGLSVYGIGMKRAFFKIGRTISVESTTEKERFRVDVDVAAWRALGDEKWDFEFSEVETLDSPPEMMGTRIEISDLTPDAARRVGTVSFAKDFLSRASSTYALFLEAGLEIAVNGNDAESELPNLSRTEDVMAPARKRFKEDDVDILILAGVTPRDDRRRHGWYVFCNGRMVLEADQTSDTGWGGKLPKWHTKFGHFVGFVLFRSDDVNRLPWRTTKQGVVVESRVYQRALAEMQIQARPVLNFLTDLYPGEVTEEGPLERDVMDNALAVPVRGVPKRDQSFKVDIEEQRKAAEARLINILYKKSKGEIDRIKGCVPSLRRASAKRVGEFAFEYLLKQECSDE